MPNPDELKPEVASELERLRQQLADAEATLAAIRNGEVDALVVTGQAGDQIFVLKSADQPYRQIVEHLQEGVALLTPRGEVLFANRRLAGLLRLPLNELVGVGFLSFCGAEDAPSFAALLRNAQHGPSAGELALQAPHQPPIPVHVSLSRLVVGDVDALSLVVSDLTQQKRSAEIIASQRLAQSILDQAGEAIVSCDQAGWVTRANAAAVDLAGRNPVGLTFEQAFPLLPASAAEANAPAPAEPSDVSTELLARALAGHQIKGLVTRLAGSPPVDLLTSAGPLRDARGHILGCLISLTDMTERRQVEVELRASEARFRALAQAVPEIVWTADPDGTITYANEHWFRYVGITPEQNARGWPELVLHPDDRERCVQAWAEALATGRDYEIEVRNRRYDGEYRWFLTRAVASRDAEGRIAGWFGVTTDIHERRMAGERQAGLLRLATTLAETSSVDQVAEAVLNIAVPRLNARLGVFEALEAEGQGFTTVRVLGDADNLVRGWPGFPAEAEARLAASGREGELLIYEALSERSALAAVQLRASDLVIGRLGFTLAGEQGFGPAEQEFLLTLARQSAVALERARLHQEARRMNQTLEQQVARRTAELEASRELTSYLQRVREDERLRVSREIHDQVGGALTGIKMDINHLHRHAARPDLDLPGRLTEIATSLDGAIDLVRQISADLRPGLLDDFGLVAAVEWQLQDYQKRIGLACQFRVALDEVEWQIDHATALFRVFQEAMTNVARHAQATRVEVTLEQEPDFLVMRIADNGRGIQTDELKGRRSLGLLGMRERLAAMSGELDIQGTRGQGTTVMIRVPLDQMRAEGQ